MQLKYLAVLVAIVLAFTGIIIYGYSANGFKQTNDQIKTVPSTYHAAHDKEESLKNIQSID